jgi:hypothetical protein
MCRSSLVRGRRRSSWSQLILALRRNRSFRPVVVATVGITRWSARSSRCAGIDIDVQLWVGRGHAQLNERKEIAIRDSVERLLAIELRRRMILVVDDGSKDRTPEILHPRLGKRSESKNRRRSRPIWLASAYLRE